MFFLPRSIEIKNTEQVNIETVHTVLIAGSEGELPNSYAHHKVWESFILNTEAGGSGVDALEFSIAADNIWIVGSQVQGNRFEFLEEGIRMKFTLDPLIATRPYEVVKTVVKNGESHTVNVEVYLMSFIIMESEYARLEEAARLHRPSVYRRTPLITYEMGDGTP